MKTSVFIQLLLKPNRYILKMNISIKHKINNLKPILMNN